MATKTDIELKIVDSVDTSHTDAEVLADSASNPDAFYVGRGYLAKGGEKVIEGIDTDGTYPNVTVGNATKATSADTATDLSGRVEATPEVFTYRPSAGDKSIKDDNAFIRRVKGNSVVFNQMLKNGNFATTTDWSPYQSANVSLNWDNGLTVTSNYAGTGGDPISVKQAIAQSFILGHKYFVHFEFSTSNTSLTPLVECFGALYNNENKLDYVQSGNNYYSINNVKATRTTVCYLKAMGTKAVGDTWTFKNVMIIDLTAMFGAGNEPTTVDEFRALYPDSYYPYKAGELRNLNCYGIRTIGFNEFNGTYARVLPNEAYYLGGEYTSIGFAKELGGATETITIPSNRLYAPTEIGYIYATGTDICINLHHTGYRDGEYEPYKEVTHALPLSQITNGQPLRKAGSVYDEINETEYIRRVGVRGYATGDKDDATLLTDGTYTNYPLAEPIVTPITTPIDFNYYVEDFGTEEALLADDSAPFSADIVYQFNAVDQVRNNTRNIQRLQKSVFTPSGTTSQYIRGDGSYADVSELARVIPINDGEYEMPDEGDYDRRFCLTPNYYAKSPVELDDTTTIAVSVTAPEDSYHLAEYWFEFAVGETLPNIEYYQPNNSDAVFRIDGDMMTYAVNILHLISSDGGETFFGEIKNYVL